MATVFLNGRFVDAGDASVSAFDAGLQHGVGLFETMVGGVGDDGPWVMRLEEHLARLIGSARELGLSDSLQAGALQGAVLRTIEQSGLPRARVRLTITGGDLNMLSQAAEVRARTGEATSARVDPTLMIVAQPATEYPEEMFESGVSAVIADLRINPLDPTAGHKTVNYWARLRELRAAAAKRAGEAIVFQVSNHLAGGCVSNVLLVRAGRILTPIARGEEASGGAALPSPVLPGVTRAWALAWAAEQSVAVQRTMLTIDDLLGADEVILTNSSWGAMPVVRVERESIGGGEPGDMARRLREAWLEGLGSP